MPSFSFDRNQKLGTNLETDAGPQRMASVRETVSQHLRNGPE